MTGMTPTEARERLERAVKNPDGLRSIGIAGTAPIYWANVDTRDLAVLLEENAALRAAVQWADSWVLDFALGLESGPPRREDPRDIARALRQCVKEHQASRAAATREAGERGANHWGLCEGCPPANYPTDETRCSECPLRTASLSQEKTNER